MPVPDAGVTPEADALDARFPGDLAEALGVDVRLHPTGGWPIRTSPCFASARSPSTADAVQGFGSGATPGLARLRAVMEYAERHAQFGTVNPHADAVASFRALGRDAISPAECGLYSERQYATAGFGLARFSEQTIVEWSAVADLATGAARLLPVEFLYPRATLKRARLVAESSSGTAAHVQPASATRAALCEAIERDALMLFWYRRPPTRVAAVESVPDPEIRDDLRRIQRIGFVVTICSLTYDLEVPCFLVVAMKGDAFIYGAGCDPEWHRALSHAVRELSQSLRQLEETPAITVVSRPLLDIQTPADHYGLYNRGPLHGVLRQVLARTLVPVGTLSEWSGEEAALDDADAVDVLVRTLAARGWHAYSCDITPPEIERCGVRVVRVVVPGLVPVHFGYNRLRLGCRRLVNVETPGRLATLQPHFFA